MDFLHKFEAPTFPPVHGRTGYSFEAAATSFIEDGATRDKPFGCLGVSAEEGVYVSERWVGPVEKGSLNTEPQDEPASSVNRDSVGVHTARLDATPGVWERTGYIFARTLTVRNPCPSSRFTPFSPTR